MIRTIALLILAAAAAFGQTYTYTRSATLAASAEVVTIQLPSGASKTAKFVSASIYCSVACDITIERTGTAASTTAGTITPVNRYPVPAQARAYYSSNVGAGTAISVHTVAASGTLIFDLSAMRLDNPGDNITFRTSSITGDVKINVQWEER